MKAKRFLIFFHIMCIALLLVICTQAQTFNIESRVTAEEGSPVERVSIIVKGSRKGTATNNAGEFSINASSKEVLIFSPTGFTRQEIQLRGQQSLSVHLKALNSELGEVVVVGYGTQCRKQTTGSIASIKSAELTQTPVANVAQGLQLRVPGVQINQHSGAPGSNVSVRLRGTNAVTGTSEPLYVMDGIQISNSGGITDVGPLSTIG